MPVPVGAANEAALSTKATTRPRARTSPHRTSTTFSRPPHSLPLCLLAVLTSARKPTSASPLFTELRSWHRPTSGEESSRPAGQLQSHIGWPRPGKEVASTAQRQRRPQSKRHPALRRRPSSQTPCTRSRLAAFFYPFLTHARGPELPCHAPTLRCGGFR
ncbi:hypothetical protein DFH27DRAFT_186944 [Peziza echinospora]|nr:hypothetical protein DFH27DRAFT_186944 [Peziza echinospora]